MKITITVSEKVVNGWSVWEISDSLKEEGQGISRIEHGFLVELETELNYRKRYYRQAGHTVTDILYK